MIEGFSSVEVVLGRYQRQVFTTPGLVAQWSFSEFDYSGGGGLAHDSSGNGHHASYAATGISKGPSSHQNLAGVIDYFAGSSTGYVFQLAHNAAFNMTSSLTIEIFGNIQSASATAFSWFDKGQNYMVYFSAGAITLWGQRASDNGWQPIAPPITVDANQWHHYTFTYDATLGGRSYFDSVLVGSLAGQGNLVPNATIITANGSATGAYFSELNVYNLALSATQVQTHYRAAVWTDITADVVSGSINLRYGINGDGPTDCTASTGEAHFSMRNDVDNSGKTQGWYSPAAGQKRPGWDFGIPCRITVGPLGMPFPKFYGKIRVINPVSGKWRKRTVDVVAYDIIRDLAESDVRQVTVQQGQSETQLLDALLAVIPDESKPKATNFDAGVDVFPVAFDNLEGSAKALKVMSDIAQSSIGMLFSDGGGNLRYRSRQSLSVGGSQLLIDNMTEVSVPSSLDKIYNRVRVTMHPKVISPTANEVLYTLPATSSNAIKIPPLGNIELWTDYSDPNDRQTKVGGLSIVTPVNNVHYVGNTTPDSTGTNASSSLTATLYPFSSTAKWSITNTHASINVYLVGLQVVGKAVRDPGPQTLEAVAPFAPVDRPVNLDLPYQNDPYVGQSVADYTISLYSKLPTQVQAVTFMANKAATAFDMVVQMMLELGDRVTISEQITAVSAVMCHIRSISIQVKEKNIIMVTYGLKPASVTGVWALGIVGSSELGVSSILGI